MKMMTPRGKQIAMWTRVDRKLSEAQDNIGKMLVRGEEYEHDYSLANEAFEMLEKLRWRIKREKRL